MSLKQLCIAVAVVSAYLVMAAPAMATPVATSDEEYQVLGRVFPDPLAGCQNLGTSPCSPNAQGNVPATQFIQYQEFLEALEYMNRRSEWQRHMEVLVLDGKLGANEEGEGPSDDALGVGDKPDDAMFPGNNMPLEFDPKPEHRSAGLPTSDVDRLRSDLITVRVTDESVPDAGKKRYALSLSIHGIERAGAEGGIRAMEDVVTAFSTGRDGEPVVPASVDPGAPTFAEVLEKTIIYFTFPNPDGWRRGSLVDTDKGPGVFFQRYNGNGVDLNRDWPDIGFSFAPYSGLSEPETRAFADYFTGVQEETGDRFQAGDDLHGQPFADALSYTLLPHGRHDFAKNERIRETVIAIHRASEEALTWSPIVKPNEPDGVPREGSSPCVPTLLGDACTQIYGQTWGTVYDTINYTTTGALGDWFDSEVGLGADGIDNEMSFSHLDKNIVFDPHTEQLHVDGNKALIYAHLATLLDPAEGTFDAPGSKGYVPNQRLTREEQDFQGDAPEGTSAQADITDRRQVTSGTKTIFPIEVKRGLQPADGSPDAGKDVYNGGMRVEVTSQSLQGVNTGTANLKIQCRGCDDHPGTEHEDGWVTVAEDFNQSEIYLQAGVTAAINRPQQDSKGTIEWRAVLSGDVFDFFSTANPSALSTMDVRFTRGPATVDASSEGDEPPQLAGYDVANTDFFEDLNGAIPGEEGDFQPIEPASVIAGEQSIDGLDTLVLADDPLPGYSGEYGPPITDPPSDNFAIASETQTIPGVRDPTFDEDLGTSAGRVPGSYETREWEVSADRANKSMTVQIGLPEDNGDFDIYLYRVEGEEELLLGRSTTPGSNEKVVIGAPAPGSYRLYVDNWLATADTDWTGSVSFEGYADDSGDTGAFSTAEKDTWMAALRDFAQGGGNLVLTDGSLRALPDLVDGLSRLDVAPQTVYVGQMTFDRSSADGDETAGEEPNLATDPTSIEQPGSRYNGGFRRQTFEPTPLGFAIQDEGGNDASNARQYHVVRDAWEGAGGSVDATSVSSSDDAQPVYDRVTLGELALGDGRIRIAGAILPQPSQAFSHSFGLEPYATTYTAYILMRNLLEVVPRDHEDPEECEPGQGKNSDKGNGGRGKSDEGKSNYGGNKGKAPCHG